MNKTTFHNFYCALALLLNVGCIQEGTENREELYGRVPAASAPPPTRSGSRTPPRQNASPIPKTNRSATEPEVVKEVTPTQGNDSDKLAAWYSVRANYETVMDDVREFYTPVRPNGCVAFLSAALRRIGVNIPIRTTAQESPSLVTLPFSQFLEKQLGWQRIGSASNLKSGDIVFTRDNPSYPGYPAHTYMFQSWSRRELGIALVIDNQDFTHERNIYDNDTAFNFTPYAYGLRAP